jgi:arylsulfatase A-like enzyme
VEVAVRASPQAGHSAKDTLLWLGLSVLLGAGAGLGAALVSGRFSRSSGLLAGLLLASWGSINYRFELVLNNFLYEPKVWGGVLLIAAASLLLGWLLDRLVRWLSPWFLIGCMGVAAVLSLLRSQEPAGIPGHRTSVLVISMDTTRADHLSAYGYSKSQPALDQLAREGAVFTEAIANAPITEPSHLAMFTGIPPYQSGIVSNGTKLGDRPALIWHDFKKQGYRTGGFVAGFPLHGKYGWGQGMDVWEDDFGAVPGMQALSLIKLWNQVAIKEHALRERTADRVLSRVLPWLKAHREEDFFLFVHFYDAHGPYTAPDRASLGSPPTNGAPLKLPQYWPASDRQITDPDWLVQAYDQEILYVDAAIGQILEMLGDKLDQTLVVVTADHGESLTEHNYLFDHGDDLYEPSLEVPFIIRLPKAVSAGTRVECPVSGVDLAPTVLELVGLSDSHSREGVSRVAELQGQDCREKPHIASTVSPIRVNPPLVDHALRQKHTKAVRKSQQDGSFLREFYDLSADPGELSSRLEDPRAEPVFILLDQYLSYGSMSLSSEMDPETQQILEALGYLEQK